jgi:hypothetical protein
MKQAVNEEAVGSFVERGVAKGGASGGRAAQILHAWIWTV